MRFTHLLLLTFWLLGELISARPNLSFEKRAAADEKVEQANLMEAARQSSADLERISGYTFVLAGGTSLMLLGYDGRQSGDLDWQMVRGTLSRPAVATRQDANMVKEKLIATGKYELRGDEGSERLYRLRDQRVPEDVPIDITPTALRNLKPAVVQGVKIGHPIQLIVNKCVNFGSPHRLSRKDKDLSDVMWILKLLKSTTKYGTTIDTKPSQANPHMGENCRPTQAKTNKSPIWNLLTPPQEGEEMASTSASRNRKNLEKAEKKKQKAEKAATTDTAASSSSTLCARGKARKGGKGAVACQLPSTGKKVTGKTGTTAEGRKKKEGNKKDRKNPASNKSASGKGPKTTKRPTPTQTATRGPASKKPKPRKPRKSQTSGSTGKNKKRPSGSTSRTGGGSKKAKTKAKQNKGGSTSRRGARPTRTTAPGARKTRATKQNKVKA